MNASTFDTLSAARNLAGTMLALQGAGQMAKASFAEQSRFVVEGIAQAPGDPSVQTLGQAVQRPIGTGSAILGALDTVTGERRWQGERRC